jgi:GNAT superfamily N-acetyltransferase
VPNRCPSFEIEPLGERHLREVFSCGHDEIDHFFREKALSDHDAYKVRIKVAVQPADGRILGFYSLVLGALQPKTLGGLIKRKFGNRAIPTIYLAAVAVDKEYERCGLGTLLMLDAFEKTLLIADHAGAACMTLDAINDERAAWYEGLQFESFGHTKDGKVQMFIPLPTIRDALA